MMDPATVAEMFNGSVAVAVLAAIGWGGKHACSWAASEIFVPIRDAVVAHLEHSDEAYKTLATSMKNIEEEFRTTMRHLFDEMRSLRREQEHDREPKSEGRRE